MDVDIRTRHRTARGAAAHVNLPPAHASAWECSRVRRLNKKPDRLIKGEAYLQGNLPVLHFAFLDMAPGFDNLEPTQVSHGFTGRGKGVLNGVFNTRL